MQSSDVPSKSPIIFGASATGTFIRSVPQTTADPAAASFNLGFPPQTFTDEGAGGTPPDGRDFNGILNFLSAWSRWESAGAPVVYDGTFQTAIDGYPKGAVVASAATFGLFWLSTAENNTTNPDAAGAGWRKFTLSGGLIGLRFITASTTYAPTDGTSAIEVTAIGAGGGGGGTGTMGSSQFGAGGGGGSGSWGTSFLTSGFSSIAITIGVGGAGGVGGTIGGSGGQTSFGTLIVSDGGGAGAVGVSGTSGSCQVGGPGGPNSAGSNRYSAGGNPGQPGISFTTSDLLSGGGGGTPWGGGGAALPAVAGNGHTGGGFGSGGSGAVGQNSSAAKNGGQGAPGLVIVREYA